MCGRYAVTKNPAKLVEEFGATDATEGQAPKPNHNVAPTKTVPTVVQRHPRNDDGEPDQQRTERTLRLMRWGLVPFWAKDSAGGARMINARSETASSKPAFRAAMKKRRCLIPADGWFEWRRDPEGKQPFYMTDPSGASLAFAGLWETWRAKDAEPDTPPLVTCTVLTTAAIGQLTEVHDRMPLLMQPDNWARWLDPDVADATDLLEPPGLDVVDGLELRPVSSAVNSVRNNGPELLDRVEPAVDLGAVGGDSPTLFDAGGEARVSETSGTRAR
ncbi:putative SOS response-associated peptidase YedK [Tamaricihabitans halophyticus]|uniref:Abasic site processing protein n=1 Tax=Tamaricihabitans halophyticus TaxID=1262583 RepID=A0A4R2QIN1_9PSEU|nr:SOS response-associated peptidase [Tamaricihabitans halophyticus]TCP49213.1 putative SOS response-associated peptidase YedK [Tamaricihabitans halophyticus]